MSDEKTTEAVEKVLVLFKEYDFDFYDALGTLEVVKARIINKAYKDTPKDAFDNL